MKILTESYGYITEKALMERRANDFDRVFSKVDRYSRLTTKSLNEGRKHFVGNIMYDLNEQAAIKDMFALTQANVARHIYEAYVMNNLDCDFQMFQKAINEWGLDNLKNMVKNGVNKGKELVHKGVEKGKELVGKGKEYLNNLADKIWQLVPEKIRKAFLMVVELAKKAIKNVKEFVDAIEDMLISFGQNIRDALLAMGGFGKEVISQETEALKQEKKIIGEAFGAGFVMSHAILEKEEDKDNKKPSKNVKTYECKMDDEAAKKFEGLGMKYEGEGEMYNAISLMLTSKIANDKLNGLVNISEHYDKNLSEYVLNEGIMSSIKDKLDQSGVTSKVTRALDWSANCNGEKPAIELLFNKLAKPITNSQWFQSFCDSDIWDTKVGKGVKAVFGVFKKLLVSMVNSVIYTKCIPMVITGLAQVLRAGVAGGMVASGVGIPIAIIMETGVIVLKWGWITKNFWALYRRHKYDVDHNGAKMWTFGFVFQIFLTVGIPVLTSLGTPLGGLVKGWVEKGSEPMSSDSGIIQRVTHTLTTGAGFVLQWLMNVFGKLMEWTGIKSLLNFVTEIFARVLDQLGHLLGEGIGLETSTVNNVLAKVMADFGFDYNSLHNSASDEWSNGTITKDRTDVTKALDNMKNSSNKELMNARREAMGGSGAAGNMLDPNAPKDLAKHPELMQKYGTQVKDLQDKCGAYIKRMLHLTKDIDVVGELNSNGTIGDTAISFADGSHCPEDLQKKFAELATRFYEQQGMKNVFFFTTNNDAPVIFTPIKYAIKPFHVMWSLWSGVFKKDENIRFRFSGQDVKGVNAKDFKVVNFRETTYKELNDGYKTEALRTLLRMEKDNLKQMHEYVSAYQDMLRKKQRNSGITEGEKKEINEYFKKVNDYQDIDNHKFCVVEILFEGERKDAVAFSYATMCGADMLNIGKETLEDNPEYRNLVRKTPYYMKGLFANVYLHPKDESDDTSRDVIHKMMYELLSNSFSALMNWGNFGVVNDDKNEKFVIDKSVDSSRVNKNDPMMGNFSLSEVCDIFNKIQDKDFDGVYRYFSVEEGGKGAAYDSVTGKVISKTINEKTLEKYKKFVESEVVPRFKDDNRSGIKWYYMRHNKNIYDYLYDEDGNFQMEKIFLHEPLYLAAFTRPMLAYIHTSDQTNYSNVQALFSSKAWSKSALADEKMDAKDKKIFYQLAKRVSEKFWELYDVDWNKLRREYDIPEDDGDDDDYEDENDWGHDPVPTPPAPDDDDDDDYTQDNHWGEAGEDANRKYDTSDEDDGEGRRIDIDNDDAEDDTFYNKDKEERERQKRRREDEHNRNFKDAGDYHEDDENDYRTKRDDDDDDDVDDDTNYGHHRNPALHGDKENDEIRSNDETNDTSVGKSANDEAANIKEDDIQTSEIQDYIQQTSGAVDSNTLRKVAQASNIDVQNLASKNDLQTWFNSSIIARFKHTGTLYNKFMENPTLKNTQWLKPTKNEFSYYISTRRKKHIVRNSGQFWVEFSENFTNNKLLTETMCRIARTPIKKRSKFQTSEYWQNQYPIDVRRWYKRRGQDLSHVSDKTLINAGNIYFEFYKVISEYAYKTTPMDRKLWNRLLVENRKKNNIKRYLNENYKPSYMISDNDLKFLVEGSEDNIYKMFEVTTNIKKNGITTQDIIEDARTQRLCEYDDFKLLNLYNKLDKYL